MVVPMLATVSQEARHHALGDRYLCGFRLRYLRLHFNFNADTLFFEDANALISLLGPMGDYEDRVEDAEENVVDSFKENGPVRTFDSLEFLQIALELTRSVLQNNIVLAGPSESYDDLHSIISHFAYVDTLIMEEPARAPRTPVRIVAGEEDRIRHQLEHEWKERRGGIRGYMPIIRFLPAQNIALMRSAVMPIDHGVEY